MVNQRCGVYRHQVQRVYQRRRKLDTVNDQLSVRRPRNHGDGSFQRCSDRRIAISEYLRPVKVGEPDNRAATGEKRGHDGLQRGRHQWLSSATTSTAGDFDSWRGHGHHFHSTGQHSQPVPTNNADVFDQQTSVTQTTGPVVVFGLIASTSLLIFGATC